LKLLRNVARVARSICNSGNLGSETSAASPKVSGRAKTSSPAASLAA